jgi:hypothetical protein
MGNDPTVDPRILEAMEACRPGSDDVSDPAMEPLRRQLSDSPELTRTYQRLQRLDQALADAFRDVPVPEGLQHRILARLETAGVQKTSPAASLSRDAEGVSVPGTRSRRDWRRRWLIGACGVAAAAALVLGVLLHLQRSDAFSKSDVPDMLNLAIEHFTNDTREGGHPIAGPVQPPREFPFSRALAAIFAPGEALFSEMRWRAVHGFLDHEAVAYDLVGRRGVSATVYVATCSVEGLTTEVPLRPMLSTGQGSASAWQEGDLLYVLVVDGGIQDYERFFATAGGPLT